MNIYRAIDKTRVQFDFLLYSNEEHFLIQFGYDYYMYIICNNLSENVISQISKLGLYVDEVDMP